MQAAVKNILEPIFEADFCPVSYGFRRASRCTARWSIYACCSAHQGGAEPERRLPYQWAIEGDIKGCFDNIDHHALMSRVPDASRTRRCRLVVAFLKAGVLEEGQFLRTHAGTPKVESFLPARQHRARRDQERYERHVWPRHTPTTLPDAAATELRALRARCSDRGRKPVLFPIRYADDFIILVSGPPRARVSQERAREVALAKKQDAGGDAGRRAGCTWSCRRRRRWSPP